MLGFARRWKYRWINFMAGADAINRRVKVEEELRDMARGKVPLPGADKCKELYLRLGIETRMWPWTALKKPNAGVPRWWRVVDPRTMATHSEIADAVRGIEKERREAVRELLRDFDQGYYYPNLKDMREACGRLGHKWRFTHLGPLSDPWFSCGVCHASECRPERESA